MGCMEILKEIPLNNVHFIPSELNSGDKLTRPQKTEDIFKEIPNWFVPSPTLNVEGVPQFEQDSLKWLTQKEKISLKEIEERTVESCNVAKDIQAVNPENCNA